MAKDINRAQVNGLFLCPKCNQYTIHTAIVQFSHYDPDKGGEVWMLDKPLRCVWCGMSTDELVVLSGGTDRG